MFICILENILWTISEIAQNHSSSGGQQIELMFYAEYEPYRFLSISFTVYIRKEKSPDCQTDRKEVLSHLLATKCQNQIEELQKSVNNQMG